MNTKRIIALLVCIVMLLAMIPMSLGMGNSNELMGDMGGELAMRVTDDLREQAARENLRTSGLGDTLTADGYHLKDTYGDYTAALTWFCSITGESPEAVEYRPATIADHWEDIAHAVKSAISTPYAVTPIP
mgnify:CR=1 FL=1